MEQKNEEIEIDLIELLSKVKDNLFKIVLFAVLGCLIGLFYLFNATPVYEATLSMYVSPLKASGSMDDLIGSGLGSSTSKIDTEMEILNSDLVLKSALDSLDLTKYADNKGELYSEKVFTAKDLSNKVSTSCVNSTKVIEITVSDSNPAFVADYANAIGKAFVDVLSSIMKETKSAQRVALEAQIPENEALLEVATNELIQFVGENEITQVETKMAALTEGLAEIQLRELPPLLLQQSEIDLRVGRTVDYLTQNENIKAQFDLLCAASKEYYYYTSGKTIATERALTLKSQLERQAFALETAIMSLVGYENSNTDDIAKYLSVSAQINALNEIESEYKAELNSYQELMGQETMLEQKVSLYQTILVSLNQLLEETKMVENSSRAEVSTIDIAKFQEEPVKPEKVKVLLISFICGALFGVLIVIIPEFLDSTIYTEKDLRKHLGDKVNSIGWLPYYSPVKTNNDMLVQSEKMIVLNDPEAYDSERYRMICANLLLLTGDESKVLVFNSCEFGEGKTTVSANIACSLAILGKKVLIIDADFRRPELERFFGLKRQKKGMYNLVFDDGNEAKRDCIVQPFESLENFHFLPTGKRLNNPNIILGSNKFEHMINELKSIYDFIIIDCPPLSFGSDFMLISQYIDAYAIVCRAGVDNRESIQMIKSSKENIKATFLGYIMNGLIVRSEGYGAYAKNYGYGGIADVSGKKKLSGADIKRKYKKIRKKEYALRESSERLEGKIQPLPANIDLEKKPSKNSDYVKKPDVDDFLAFIENDPKAKGK